MDHGALDHALESSGRPGILPVLHNQAVQLFIDEIFEVALERVDIDVAPGQHG